MLCEAMVFLKYSKIRKIFARGTLIVAVIEIGARINHNPSRRYLNVVVRGFNPFLFYKFYKTGVLSCTHEVKTPQHFYMFSTNVWKNRPLNYLTYIMM